MTDLMLVHKILSGANGENVVSQEELNKKQKRTEYKINQATIVIKKVLFEYLKEYEKLLSSFQMSMIAFSAESFIHGIESEELENTLHEMKTFCEKCKKMHEFQQGVMAKIHSYDDIIVDRQINFGNDLNNYIKFLNTINSYNKTVVNSFNILKDYIKTEGANKFINYAKKPVKEVIDTYYENNKIINNEITPRIRVPYGKKIPKLHESK